MKRIQLSILTELLLVIPFHIQKFYIFIEYLTSHLCILKIYIIFFLHSFHKARAALFQVRKFLSLFFTQQLTTEHFQFLTRIHYFDQGDGNYGEHEIDYILFLQKNLEINPNPQEVSETRWLKLKNLDEQIKSLDGPLTPWFKLIYESGLLKMWWENLDRIHEFHDYRNILRMPNVN